MEEAAAAGAGGCRREEARVGVVVGSMTFGKQTSADTAQRIVALCAEKAQHYQHSSHVEIDSAFMYENGRSETIVGNIERTSQGVTYTTATKANPYPFSGKSLRPEVLLKQFNTSLTRLGMEKVDIFYLHSPDNRVPIEQTLEACNDLYQQGKYKELGLSNYAAWQVVEIYHICQAKGWVLPTVYQGMYNPLTRSVESELFPALRKYNIRFYVFNPLAGGLLTGKYASFQEKPAEGRFHERKNYNERYWKKSYFEALDTLAAACQSQTPAITMTEAAFRWLLHHSKLEAAKGDKIILGGSTLSHWEENLTYCYEGAPLPAPVLEAFDAAWDQARAVCPPYFRDE
eukprot:TRINITY_DN1987_c0_g2_i2.p1 TRINITY_DN1987_c0_g2~~TRINITY_DN1987_c0_g2_i2.p1  ORF type:complete len:352 (+),score=52.73 TRINITY_DN1987_c0_g2_i2:26-1057(+)